jgi:hypothetical protein
MHFNAFRYLNMTQETRIKETAYSKQDIRNRKQETIRNDKTQQTTRKKSGEYTSIERPLFALFSYAMIT